MNEAIAVEARFEADGRIRPQAFTWRARRYAIHALGRQWEQDGERRFLVMTAGDRVYELAFRPVEGRWWLRRGPEQFGHHPATA